MWLIEVGRGVPSRFTFDAAIETPQSGHRTGARSSFGPLATASTTCSRSPQAARLTSSRCSSRRKRSHRWTGRGMAASCSTARRTRRRRVGPLGLTNDGPERVKPFEPFPVCKAALTRLKGSFPRWAVARVCVQRVGALRNLHPDVSGGGWEVAGLGGGRRAAALAAGRPGTDYVAPDTRLMAVPIRLAPDTHTLEAGAPVALFPTRLATGGNIAAPGFRPGAVCRRARWPVSDERRRRRCGHVADHHRPKLDGGAEEVTIAAGTRLGASRFNPH